MAKADTWADILGIPKPSCCNLKAACCAVATPSLPVPEMFRLAAQGDETCRDFLSVFIAHASAEAARTFYREDPGHIDRVLGLVGQQQTRVSLAENDVVFYHCRYLDAERRCQVYEDRPTFCRDYPTSPLNILVKGCGYQAWADACKHKLRTLGYEVAES
ncbi:MAG: YkgJ family cysteine cluster protein [Candidatus Melainabacteria bacterium]|nr:YkgJ family cysteine cluster protein [Candidatus Melainabacteria bacterium]